MKKMKLISLFLLTVLFAVNLTACSADKKESDSAVNNSESTETPETTENNTDNVANLEPEVFSDAPLVNSGMGIENSVYFATPLSNGEPLDITAMDEISLVNDIYDICTGATINMAALSTDYIVGELDGYSVYLGSGAFNYDDDEYEQELEIYMDYMNAFEDYYAEKNVYEVVDDITFYYEYGDLSALKMLDDVYICITYYSNDELDESTLQNLKTEMLDIYANTSIDYEVEVDYATACKFDALSFDCGWCVADITSLEWDSDRIIFDYKDDDLYVHLRFYIDKMTGSDMAGSIEYEDDEVYEVLIDESGNRIGYIDTYTRDDKNMRYCIRSADGSYMDVEITNFYGSSPIDIHNWSEIEAFLNSGN